MNREFISKCLPFEVPREQQIEALEFIRKSSKRFIVLEMPTGSGKSGVAYGAVNLGNSAFGGDNGESGEGYKSYILTSQKILQEQYKNDFGNLPGFADLRGTSNYKCAIEKTNCSNAPCKFNPKIKVKCKEQGICPYINALGKFMSSSVGLTNYSWFLSYNLKSPHGVEMRDFLILDEAHNIENEVTKYFSFEIDLEILGKIVEIELGHFSKASNVEVFELLEKGFLLIDEAIVKSEVDIENLLKKRASEGDNIITRNHINVLYKNIEGFKLLKEQLKGLITYKTEDWIVTKYLKDYNNLKVNFQPITTKGMLRDLLFNYGRKVIFLSATLGSKEDFCRSIGVSEDSVDFKAFESTFPIKNRVIHCMNTAKMGNEYIQSALPLIVRDVERILDDNYNVKGIIHTQSFQIANYIKDNISSEFKNRLIFNESGGTKDALEEHTTGNKRNSVLCTPSMFEGVDLADNLSRFQIIVKTPFPYLGDPLVREKQKRNERYLAYEMIKKVIQMAGRSVRHENDKCTTYVLDSSFKYWIEQNKKHVPKYFYDSIDAEEL